MITKFKILSILLVITINYGIEKKPNYYCKNYNSATKETESTFKLVRSGSKVSIYARWIPVSESRLARQIKAEFTINCPRAKVISVLRDEATYTKWMSSTRSYYRVKTINPNEWYSYVQFSIPWPLNNQDCILKYKILDHPAKQKTTISLKSEPNYLESYEGIERISHMEALWEITQIDSHKTQVEYYVYSNQEPKFPRWATDPLIQKKLIKTMQGLREMALNGN